jgi:3-hydroxyacyl-CoA dehydrogenase/3a,7a,12a-trihydroxy-5b-cholest-24-enoyl-CoA hydratase
MFYNRRDILIYALGIGCEEQRFVYEKDKQFAVFPTFPFALGFKGDSVDVVSFPSPAMMRGPIVAIPGTKVVLDGERFMEKVNDLPTSPTKLVLRSRIVGVHARGKGALVETESELLGKDGTLYYRMSGGGFHVGATGFTDCGITHSERLPPPSRAPDTTVEFFVPKNQSTIYRLSGDYNPLHIDQQTAQRGGFERPILHGLCSLGFTARAVLATFGGNDPARFKAMKARFSSPVLPGSTLCIDMWKDGNRVWVSTRVKETNKVSISDAYVDFHPPQSTAAKL